MRKGAPSTLSQEPPRCPRALGSHTWASKEKRAGCVSELPRPGGAQSAARRPRARSEALGARRRALAARRGRRATKRRPEPWPTTDVQISAAAPRRASPQRACTRGRAEPHSSSKTSRAAFSCVVSRSGAFSESSCESTLPRQTRRGGRARPRLRRAGAAPRQAARPRLLAASAALEAAAEHSLQAALLSSMSSVSTAPHLRSGWPTRGRPPARCSLQRASSWDGGREGDATRSLVRPGAVQLLVLTRNVACHVDDDAHHAVMLFSSGPSQRILRRRGDGPFCTNSHAGGSLRRAESAVRSAAAHGAQRPAQASAHQVESLPLSLSEPLSFFFFLRLSPCTRPASAMPSSTASASVKSSSRV